MSAATNQATASFLKELSHQLREGMDKVCHCFGQLNEEQIRWRPSGSQNSIANLVLHLEGNVRQWVISGVAGELDIRDRPAEFSATIALDQSELLAKLSNTVNMAIETISNQTEISVLEQRRIQGFDTTVAGAIIDSVAHFRGHTQEIISLTRQQLQERYKFYFIPQSTEQGA